jgi:hypothetical protein
MLLQVQPSSQTTEPPLNPQDEKQKKLATYREDLRKESD